MGLVLECLVFRKGKEPVTTEFESLLDIPAIDIDGNKLERLG